MNALLALREGAVSIARLTLLLALLLLGCREPGLQSSMGAVHLEPAHLDFGLLYVDQSAAALITVRNEGRASVSLLWTLPDQPFELINAPDQAMSGSNDFAVRFHPASTGQFSSRVSFEANGAQEETLL